MAEIPKGFRALEAINRINPDLDNDYIRLVTV